MKPIAGLIGGLCLATACQTARRSADEPRVFALHSGGSGASPGFVSEPLFASPELSVHHVRASAPLAAHVHRVHEETVIVLSGRARMLLGDVWHDLASGSVVHVPRGVVHAVEPDRAAGPVSAVSIFAPPFDGEDRVFVEAP